MQRCAVLIVLALAGASPAFAHSASRGFVLLLPVGLVIAGGALAVLVSFCAISLLPDRWFLRAVECRKSLRSLPAGAIHGTSLASAALLASLIWIGFAGPHDPVENLLPLSIWTAWWVIVVLLHPIFGNLWAALNPFTGLHALVGSRPRLEFPPSLAFLPSFFIFAAFAWFQLVHPAPEDPPRLALAVLVYAALTLVAVWTFGPADWLGKGDPFAVFLTQLGAMSPFGPGEPRLPGVGLVKLRALPFAGTFFVLLTLSSISFDGFAGTFLWLSSTGVNPLDYPGRTAMMTANTLGLGMSFALLTLLFFASVSAGWAWAGRPGTFQPLAGRLVLSLLPISIAYHFAHYLSGTLVNLQYLAFALNDPMGSGANLLGLAGGHVTASFQNTASGTLAIFAAQCAAVIAGHIAGVAVAHAIALQLGLPRPVTLRLEAPLAVFMVIYTAFGLWLLAAPAIG